MFGFETLKIASIEHAISGITAAIAELRVVETLEFDKAMDFTQSAVTATTNAKIATDEGERAGRIANNLDNQIA